MCHLKEFRIFVAAFEERSFSAAAKRENVTQSGVSQCIKKIERALGVALFVRTARCVEPTSAGERYYRSSMEILKTQDKACSELKSVSALDGEISVMAPTWLSSRVLPRVIARFTEEYRQIRVVVVNTGEWGELQLARRGAFSVSFSDVCHDADTLLASPLVLLSSSRKEFARASAGDRGSFKELRIVKPSDHHLMGKMISEYMLRANMEPEATLEINSILGILALVEDSNWSALLPAFVLAEETSPMKINVETLADVPSVGLRLDISGSVLSIAAGDFVKCLNHELRVLERRSTLRYPVHTDETAISAMYAASQA